MTICLLISRSLNYDPFRKGSTLLNLIVTPPRTRQSAEGGFLILSAFSRYQVCNFHKLRYPLLAVPVNGLIMHPHGHIHLYGLLYDVFCQYKIVQFRYSHIITLSTNNAVCQFRIDHIQLVRMGASLLLCVFCKSLDCISLFQAVLFAGNPGITPLL